jgi:hypothetical protein
MHNKKLSARARRAIRERMTPEMRKAEDIGKLAILNDWRKGHGLPTLNAKEAGLEDA